MRYEFRYLDPPSNPDQDPDPDQEFWLSIWWGNRGADFWISFFRKIHIRGVLTFWPWCYFLTLVSRLPAFFGRSYPSGCIGHRPLVSSDLRTYDDRCRARVPSNHAACFPPFISVLRHNCFEMIVMGKISATPPTMGIFHMKVTSSFCVFMLWQRYFV